MKFSVSLLSTALAASGANAAAINMRAGNSWAGSNLYFLHGMSDSDQDSYINTLADYGAKVVRLWATGISSGCQKGSNVAEDIPDLEDGSIGNYNDKVLDALDKTISKLVNKGIKAIVSPHDGNAFGYNSCDVYCNKYPGNGSDENAGANYYQSSEAAAAIDKRYAHVLNYQGATSGKKWADWSEGILAFDLENEPFQQAQDLAGQNDPSNWLCRRAMGMKQVLGSSDVKVATGGIGGDQSHGFNFLPKAMDCKFIDIMSVHGYVSTADFWSGFLPDNVQKSEQAGGKLVMVEEWGVSTDYEDDFNTQAAAIDKTGVPWTYWQFTEYDEGSCSGGCCSGGWDGFEVGLHSDKGDAKGGIQEASSASSAQDWSAVVN